MQKGAKSAKMSAKALVVTKGVVNTVVFTPSREPEVREIAKKVPKKSAARIDFGYPVKDRNA